MTIDPRTGALTLDDGTRLDPDYARDEFLSSDHAKRGREGVQNEPWSSWVVPEVKAGGKSWKAMLCFSDGQLGMLDLVLQAPEFGCGWQDHSAEKERARKKAHDAWLESELGPPASVEALVSTWTLEGCEVLSLHDKRTAASAINVRFGWEKDDGEEE